MQATQIFGHEQIFGELIRGVVDAVAGKSGLSPERRSAAQQAAVCSVMAFIPRDPVETMLAGQCVVYDHMLRDGAKDMLLGQAEVLLIKARPGVLAAGKMFLGTLTMLLRMQRRTDAQLAFARPVVAAEQAPEQPIAAPAAAAAAPEAPPDHDSRPVANPWPVPPEALTAASTATAAQVAKPVQRTPAPSATTRQASPPEHPWPRMIDIRDPAVMAEITAGAMLVAQGGT